MKKRIAILLTAVLLFTVAAPAVSAPAATTLVTASVPTGFSPDGDGVRDRLILSYRLSTTVRVSMSIYQGSTLIRTLRAGSFQTAGPHSSVWDGRNNYGKAAPIGQYRWVLTAKRVTRLGTRTRTLYGYTNLNRVKVPRWVGFYVPGAPMSISPLDSLESKVATVATVSNYFQDTSQGFTWTQASNASKNGSIPLITLEFWRAGAGTNQPAYSLKKIAGGSWDAYIRQYARDAKAFGKPVWLRPLHEMNGDWYPWGATVNGNTPADFISAWRRVRTIFKQEGATNVKFVWCPNADSVPRTTTNTIKAYWPGKDYVDIMAIDGYNFGGTGWRSFSKIMGPAYATVTSLSTKPLIIAETGCASNGGDKAMWIREMFRCIPQTYPRIKGVTWFNANKERDWRVESSTETLSSYKYWVSRF